MAFVSPNAPPAPPNAPPAPVAPPVKTLADVSAQGTTQGAPVAQISKGPPLPGQAPAGGPVPARPVVAPHAGMQSVGTHPPAAPQMQGNPTYGMNNA
jgi:hypothetical protein